MKVLNINLIISLSLFLVACSSSPVTSFYQLRPIEAAVPYSSQAKNLTLLINKIKFPEYLDRPQIVTRKSDYKLQLNENHHWAEPLKNEFTQVFIENINTRMGSKQSVMLLKQSNRIADISVNIEVLQLDVNTDNLAVLTVKWSYWGNTKVLLNPKTEIKSFEFKSKNNTQESKVEAQSQTIAAFSEYLIDSLLAALN